MVHRLAKYILEKQAHITLLLMRSIPNTEKIANRYLYYYLTSPLFQNPLEAVSKRGAQDGFNKDNIALFEIPVPPLEEQRCIVAILDEAFEGLETAQANARANLASAEELLGSVVGEYLKNKVQTQRTTTTLKAICSKIGSGATPKGGEKSYKETGVPLVRSLNVYDREFRYGKIAYLDEDQAASLANVTLKQGDVLLNITGASVARCCVLPNDLIGGRVNQHVSIIRIKENILHPELLSYILTSNETKHVLLAVGNTGGTTRQAITKSQIEGFKVSFPTDYQEQSKLVIRLQQIEKCVLSSQRNLRDKSIEVSELRQSLLQKAFAGELT
jgi:type I restriction enzyme S subunit